VTARVRAIAAALLAATGAAAYGALAAACLDTQPCVGRGTSTQSTGSASYSGQVATGDGGGSALEGAVPVAVTIDDFTVDAASCSGNPVEFTVRVGTACVLWALATDTSGNASIEPAQTCTLPTAQGDAVVALDQGTLSTSSGTTLTLSGTIADLGDAAVQSGYLQWTFTGN
jgi:hypothetical protein